MGTLERVHRKSELFNKIRVAQNRETSLRWHGPEVPWSEKSVPSKPCWLGWNCDSYIQGLGRPNATRRLGSGSSYQGALKWYFGSEQLGLVLFNSRSFEMDIA